MTFSIVGTDPETKEFGIAVQSKFPAVGSLVPWIDLEAGAIATQALANVEYGRSGIKMLKAGLTANQLIKVLTESDKFSEHRQFGVIDTMGNSASFTGKKCYNWAGSMSGTNFACQGNILVGEETVQAMVKTFETTTGDLAERLMSALEAGQKAGGDSRGQQSGNLRVHKKNEGYGGGSDIYIDVRIDDHPKATTELRRVFELYSITLLQREDQNKITELTDEVLLKIGKTLVKRGNLDFLPEKNYNILVAAALKRWMSIENFENKERNDGFIWNSVLDYLLKL